MTSKEFIKYAKSKIGKTNIKLTFADKKYVMVQGSRVSGYFDENELVCATGNPIKKWLPIFVHEFSHFEQWQKNCKSWTQVFINGKDLSDETFKWIGGKKYSLEKIKEITRRVRILELDCERRTVKNIKKFKLPIDVDNYIRGANSYIYFYNYAMLRRRWWKRGMAPYYNPEILSHMPSKFMSRYTYLPKKYIELYDEFC